MKIAVNLTVELPDPKDWAFAHGLNTDGAGGVNAAVRADVRQMIFNAVCAGIPLLDEAEADIFLNH